MAVWELRRFVAVSALLTFLPAAERFDLVQGIVTEVNEDLATVEQVKAFRLLPKLLDHEDGELTATQKVRRAAMIERFSSLVESMYRGGGRG